MVLGSVAFGIGGTLALGVLLGVPSAQRMLIACGFSICGAAAAVAAVDGTVGAEEDVLTAISLVVFGTVMIGVVPAVVHLLALDDVQAGLFAGGSIHEVAQVVAVGGAINGLALAVATVVKLARILCLAPVIVALGVHLRSPSCGRGDAVRPPLVPAFILVFLACVTLRSCGVVPPWIAEAAGTVQTFLLSVAMVALGLGVRFSTLRGIGPRPLVLAVGSTVWVACLALSGTLLLTA